MFNCVCSKNVFKDKYVTVALISQNNLLVIWSSLLFSAVLKKACGQEAVKENDEEFVDPLPEKLRGTVVSLILRRCNNRQNPQLALKGRKDCRKEIVKQ